MNKMNNQNETVEGVIYTESKTARDETINKYDDNGIYDFLSKFKIIQYYSSDDNMVLSIDQIANFYENSKESVSTIIKRNRQEFEEDGMIVLTGEELKEFKNLIGSNELNKTNRTLTLLTMRSLLRVGMIMTSNMMSTKIRNYLLNLAEIATEEQKKWAIQREAGKIERKRMTSAISKYIPESKHKRFAYPNYTNLIYKTLFNKDAKTLREERSMKTNDLLRDSFIGVELDLVSECETIITGLLAVDFTYKQIEDMLKARYTKRIA